MTARPFGPFDVGPPVAHLRLTQLVPAQKAGFSYLLKVQADASDHLTGVRLVREARALAAISHSSVMTVSDVGQTVDGRPFLVSRAMKGQLLAQVLSQVAVLRAQFAMCIVRDLLGAVAAVHAAGYTGPELDAESIFVCTNSPEEPHPVLVDLGAVRESDADGDRMKDLVRVAVLMRLMFGCQRAPTCVERLLELLEVPPPGLLALEAQKCALQVIEDLERKAVS